VKSRRVVFSIFGILFAAILLAVALAPTFFSTSWGKEALLSYVNKRSAYRVSCDKLSLSWLGSQEVTNLHVQEKTGQEIECKQVHASASLIHILFNKDFKELTATNPTLSVNVDTLPQIASKFIPGKIRPQIASLIPSSEIKLSFFPFRADVFIKEGTLTVSSKKTVLARYEHINVTAHIPKSEKTLSFNVTGQTQENSLAGSFELTGCVQESPKTSLDLIGNFTNFPTRGIDALLTLSNPQMQGLLTEAIGPTLNLSLQGNLSSEIFNLQLKAQSSLFNADLQTDSRSGMIALSTPGTINFTLTPQFVEKLTKIVPSLEGLALKKSLKAGLKVQKFSIPIQGNELDYRSLSFQATGEIASATFVSSLTDQQINLEKIKLNLQSARLEEGIDSSLEMSARVDSTSNRITAQGKIGNVFERPITADGSWKIDQFSSVLLEELFKQKGKILPLLGPTFDAQGSFHIGKESTFKIEGSSPSLSFSPATFTLNQNLSLLSPIDICLNLAALKQTSLQSTGSLFLHVQNFSLPLGASLENMQLKSEFSLPEITYTPAEGEALKLPPLQGTLSIATLNKIHLETKIDLCDPDQGTCTLIFSSDGSLNVQKQILQMNSQLTLSENSQRKGEGKSVLEVREFFSPSPIWKVVADGQDLSLPLLEKLLHQKEMLSSLLGPSLKFHLEVEKEIARLNATSENLNVHGGVLGWKNQQLELLEGPLEIYFTLTDESFSNVDCFIDDPEKRGAFKLSQPSVLALTVSKLKMPLCENLSWKDVELVADGGMDRFSFQEKASGQIVKLENLLVKVEKNQLSAPLSFQACSKVSTKNSGGKIQEGNLSASGVLTETDDLKNPSIELSLDATQFPASILDLFAHLTNQQSVAPLFGETLEAKAHIQLVNGSGPLELNVRSPNTRFSVVGAVKNGILTLSEPVHGQMLMTEEVSQVFLKDVNPLSITAIWSSSPLTIEIASNGFSLPLHEWKRLSLSHAKIELGRLLCKNEGAFKAALNLLKSKDLAKDKTLQLWFAPMELSIQEGVVSMERTEILVAETFEIAIWGTIDLLQEYVDMTLGLTAQCLNKAFGIQNLPPDYVMHVPMKGKMNNVQVNTSAATAKVGTLLLWQQNFGSTGSDNQGLIPGLGGFGDIIGKLATLPDKSAYTPPAKHPFPWELYKPDGRELKKDSDALPKKKRIKTGDKPLKQLFKLLR
jgi:hypothetical protein